MIWDRIGMILFGTVIVFWGLCRLYFLWRVKRDRPWLRDFPRSDTPPGPEDDPFTWRDDA